VLRRTLPDCIVIPSDVGNTMGYRDWQFVMPQKQRHNDTPTSVQPYEDDMRYRTPLANDRLRPSLARSAFASAERVPVRHFAGKPWPLLN
jgi:hypothetical protein